MLVIALLFMTIGAEPEFVISDFGPICNVHHRRQASKGPYLQRIGTIFIAHRSYCENLGWDVHSPDRPEYEWSIEYRRYDDLVNSKADSMEEASGQIIGHWLRVLKRPINGPIVVEW